MHHIFALLFACFSITIFLTVLFRTKSKNIEETPCVFDDEHLVEEIIPDEYFQDTLEPSQELNEMVRLSEEAGLYDEPKKPFLYYHNIFVTEDSPPQIWIDTKGNTRYFVGMQEVTKEGYQWACWVWRDKSPYSNAGTGKNSNVEIYYK